MTVKYHCDGPDCVRAMGREERRIGWIIGWEPPPTPQWIEYDPDADEDEEIAEIDVEVELLDMYADGDFHFCSYTCLTGWAMARALDEQKAD